MAIITFSSREFNQNVSRARKAAGNGPVIITDRGRPAHVLLSIEDYQRLTGTQQNIIDLLSAPETASIRFDPPRLGRLHRAPNLS
jgi:prevent-host-death family protein